VLRRAREGVVNRARRVARWLGAVRIGTTPALTDYKAPNYWLDYRCGFVRRGLPGELLRRMVGGTPTHRQVTVFAAGLSQAAALSVVPMAIQVSRRAPDRLHQVVAATLLVLSPLTSSLLLYDVGRYDAVGVLVLALLVAARSVWARLPLPVAAVLLAAGVGLATATEEFLFAVVAPAAAAAVRSAGGPDLSPGRRLLLLCAVLAPGAAVAGVSLLVPAPRAALHAARDEATRAGVGPPGVMGDALAALDRSLVENLAFFRLFEPTPIVQSLTLWSGLYLVTAMLLGRLLGPRRSYHALAGVQGVVGAALCTVGADFRRWWGLALLGLVATIGLLEPDESVGSVDAVPTRVAVGAALLTLAGLRLRHITVYPWGPVRVDRALPVTL
jgi:hypothetical protein